MISNCQRPDVIAINHSESRNMHRNTRRVFSRRPSIKILLELDYVDWHLKTVCGLLPHTDLVRAFFALSKKFSCHATGVKIKKIITDECPRLIAVLTERLSSSGSGGSPGSNPGSDRTVFVYTESVIVHTWK